MECFYYCNQCFGGIFFNPLTEVCPLGSVLASKSILVGAARSVMPDGRVRALSVRIEKARRG
jgi:hypothetical protein